jgi:hypothetical protein
MPHGSSQALAPLMVVAVFLNGCTTPGPHAWGEDVSFAPGTQRLRDAASSAARSPRVWVPLAGAALLQINGWDRKVSDWARENTPVFGSQQSASDWSDGLVIASSVSYFATVFATPGPEDSDEWWRDKGRGLAVGLGAIACTGVATTALKYATARTRPDGESTQSFPSGHTSHSAVLTSLASDNLRDVNLAAPVRSGLTFGLDALTLGTAWARVEAGAHFPADTLVGMALGNFISAVADDAFLHGASERRVAIALAPMLGGLELQWQLAF